MRQSKVFGFIATTVFLIGLNVSYAQTSFKPSSNDTYSVNSPFSRYDITNKNASGVAEMGSRPYNQWVFEKIEKNVYRIKEVKTGKYLHIQNEGISVGDIQPNWHSAMWQLEHVSDNLYRIKCRWKKYGKPLYLQNPQRSLSIGELADKNATYGRWRIRKDGSLAAQATSNSRFKENIIEKKQCEGSQTFIQSITMSHDVTGTLWKTNVAGYVMHSADGGRSWNTTDRKMAEVSAVSKDVAWGISFQGQIYITKDAGRSWTQTSGSGTKISALSETRAWVVNGNSRGIYLTADTGKTWKRIEGVAQDISAISDRAAWVINEGNLWLTQDGGASWKMTNKNIKMMNAAESGRIWCVDNNLRIQYSYDNGASWIKESGNYHDVTAINGNRAYAQKNCGDLVWLQLK